MFCHYRHARLLNVAREKWKTDGADQPGLQQHLWSGLGLEGMSLFALGCLSAPKRDVLCEGLDSVLISRKSITIDPAQSHTPSNEQNASSSTQYIQHKIYMRGRPISADKHCIQYMHPLSGQAGEWSCPRRHQALSNGFTWHKSRAFLSRAVPFGL